MNLIFKIKKTQGKRFSIGYHFVILLCCLYDFLVILLSFNRLHSSAALAFAFHMAGKSAKFTAMKDFIYCLLIVCMFYLITTICFG